MKNTSIYCVTNKTLFQGLITYLNKKCKFLIKSATFSAKFKLQLNLGRKLSFPSQPGLQMRVSFKVYDNPKLAQPCLKGWTQDSNHRHSDFNSDALNHMHDKATSRTEHITVYLSI